MTVKILRVRDVMILLTALSACGGGVPEENYASCSDSKKSIAEVATAAELEAIEAENPSATCERLTYSDDAELLLQKAAVAGTDAEARALYLGAAEILEKLVAFYPDATDRYGRLAAAFAGAAGVELLSFVGQMAGGGNFFATGNETLPTPQDAEYTSVKSHLDKAVTFMDAKIARVGSASVADTLQNNVYRMAQSIVIANGFLVIAGDGTFDASAIDSASIEDVDALIDNLSVVAESIEDPVLKEKLIAFDNSDELTDEQKKELLKQELNKS